MSALLRDYEQIAVTLGLKFDGTRKVIYGQRNGFELVVYAENPQTPYRFSVLTGANSQMGALSKADCKQFAKEEKEVAVLVQTGNTIAMTLNTKGKVEQVCECINNGVNALTSFLKSKGFAPCCEFCGQQTETAAFDSDGHYMQLCPECADKIRHNTTLAREQKQQKGENLIGGIVGALIGSVIGILCIVFFGQLNRVAAVSGFVMAVCTIKGYEMLGGKLTKKGVVISVIIMAIMPYFGHCISMGLLVARELETDIFYGIELFPVLLEQGVIEKSSYIYDIVLLYVFTLIGAVPTVRASLKERKQEDKFGQIGSMDTY